MIPVQFTTTIPPPPSLRVVNGEITPIRDFIQRFDSGDKFTDCERRWLARVADRELEKVSIGNPPYKVLMESIIKDEGSGRIFQLNWSLGIYQLGYSIFAEDPFEVKAVEKVCISYEPL